MAKFIISLIAAVAFCYLAEAATSGEYQAIINQVSNLERQGALTRTKTALDGPAQAGVPAPPSSPLVVFCINEIRTRAYREINIALVTAQNQLRADAATRTDADLATVTPEELRQQVSDVIHPAVESVVSNLESQAANC
ncbi:hypothetical protein, partial [Acinetobacter pittii]|uniref:hypothetical protein n=1 Tax=Acinetobacter pittii TaxID=48296 RepID=UPI001A913BD9